MTELDEVKGWHFFATEGQDRTGAPIVVGETQFVAGKIECCESGLHACESLLDALRYAPGTWLQRVTLSGVIDRDRDKLAASHRNTLAVADARQILVTFARDCANRARDCAVYYAANRAAALAANAANAAYYAYYAAGYAANAAGAVGAYADLERERQDETLTRMARELLGISDDQ